MDLAKRIKDVKSVSEFVETDILDNIFSISNELERDRHIKKIRHCISEEDGGDKILKEFNKLVKYYKDKLKEKENAKIESNQIDGLVRNTKGEIVKTVDNILKILEGDKKFEEIRYNSLCKVPEKLVGSKWKLWTDSDDAEMRRYLEKEYGIYDAKKTIDAFIILLERRSFNPVRQIIESLEWDGIPRIESFLSDVMKAKNRPYEQEVSRLIFAGGINRIYRAGCKFECVPVLIGTSQGEGKSTIVRWLALQDEFYSELTDFDKQKGAEALEGSWVCEISELVAMSRTKDIEAVKSFISTQSDDYRRPYQQRKSRSPRECIFIGTTNHKQFLTDTTGNRRFFPIDVNSSGRDLFNNEEEIRNTIRQCWAEAKVRFDKGEMPPVPNPEFEEYYKAAQMSASEDDYRIGMIREYLDKNPSKAICVLELYQQALQQKYDKPSRKESRDIGEIMDKFDDWKREPKERRIAPYGTQRCWTRLKM